MSKKTNTAHDAVLAAIRQGLGKGAAGRLSDGGVSEVREVIPTGIPALDQYVLGIGGFAVGRLAEVYGEEGSGKTSLLYAAIAACQRAGGVAMLADNEQALNESRTRTFGVDPDNVILLGLRESLCMEDLLAAAERAFRAIPAGVGPNLFGWDSIASTPMRTEVEGTLLDGQGMGTERAKFLGRACKSLCKLATEKRVALLFVNQVREKIGIAFGDKYTTPGGRAVRFYASTRLQLLGGKALKDRGFHAGKDVTVLASKNRMAPPWRKARIRLDYENGWDGDWSALDLAKEWKLLPPGTRDPRVALATLEGIGWNPRKAAGAPLDGERPAEADEDGEDGEP